MNCLQIFECPGNGFHVSSLVCVWSRLFALLFKRVYHNQHLLHIFCVCFCSFMWVEKKNNFPLMFVLFLFLNKNVLEKGKWFRGTDYLGNGTCGIRNRMKKERVKNSYFKTTVNSNRLLFQNDRKWFPETPREKLFSCLSWPILTSCLINFVNSIQNFYYLHKPAFYLSASLIFVSFYIKSLRT